MCGFGTQHNAQQWKGARLHTTHLALDASAHILPSISTANIPVVPTGRTS